MERWWDIVNTEMEAVPEQWANLFYGCEVCLLAS
jgi:hypothetical protein